MAHALPMTSGEAGLSRYLTEIRRFPMLEPQEEYMLAKRWREHGDTAAAHRLVTSHLRLVAKIAMGYRGYGLPIGEVISEGNVGLMQAVKRFEPEKGFRLATYAMWWIKASIQEYILRSWSLVKLGTTASQKRLFFNLRKVKGQIQALEEGDLRPEQVAQIATRLGVTEQDVVSMNRRLSGDTSLNAPLRSDGETGAGWPCAAASAGPAGAPAAGAGTTTVAVVACVAGSSSCSSIGSLSAEMKSPTWARPGNSSQNTFMTTRIGTPMNAPMMPHIQ